MTEELIDVGDEVALEDSDEAALRGLEGDGLEDGLDEVAADDGGALEDIEYEGKTYQAPKALKGAFLRHADYTRKTQELATERRSLEAERSADAQSIHLTAGLAAIEQRLEACADIDWDQFQREDPQAAMQLRDHLEDLTAAHSELADNLHSQRAHHAFAAEQQQLQRLHAGHGELSRDVPGWSPELADRLSDFAMREFGVSDEELEAVDDPRLVKLLHAAYLGANSGGLNRQAKRLADAQLSRPAATVQGRATAGKNPNRMTTEEWMRHRNSQLRRQR